MGVWVLGDIRFFFGLSFYSNLKVPLSRHLTNPKRLKVTYSATTYKTIRGLEKVPLSRRAANCPGPVAALGSLDGLCEWLNQGVRFPNPHPYMYMYIYIYVCIEANECIDICICKYCSHIYIYIYIYSYIYTYRERVCVYIYIYMYIYIYI